MRRMFGLFLLAALSGLGTLLSSCRSPYVKVDETQRHRLAKETSVLKYEFEVERPTRRTSLELRSDLDAGAMTWRFKNPSGATVWEGSTRGHLGTSRSFDPVVGTWNLELSFEGATGDYEVYWKARR